MQKRIYVYAYTAMNLGDDLFIKILCDRYPKAIFFIMCRKDVSRAFRDIHNIRCIPDISWLDRFSSKIKLKNKASDLFQRFFSRQCDAVVNIGGSMFIQKGKWGKKAERFRKRIVGTTPFFILGSNFGPFATSAFRDRYTDIFVSANDICFRDLYSYTLFRDLPNVRYAADIVFTYPVLPVKTDNKQVVISVIDVSERQALKKYELSYINKIIEFSRFYMNKGYTVCLMGFCVRQGDKREIEKIAEKLDAAERRSIRQYTYAGDIAEAIRLIQESEHVLATRFHAMILGWISGKRVFPIVYNEKMNNVIKDTAFAGKCTTVEDIDAVDVEAVYTYLQKSEPFAIERQCVSAQTQFRFLDELLR